MTSPFVFLNGQFLPFAEAALPLHDAGFVSGATVVDNARTFRHKLFLWPDHLARFRRDCEACYIPLEATDEQLTATAFHRNTMTNNEGGTNDEEFRNVAIVDRVNTTFTVWMGTSIMCCQCHTHKYDPITQKEFFQVFAFFNNTADADRRDESPLLEFWSEEQETAKAQLRKKIQALEKRPEWTSRFLAMVTYKHLIEMKPATTVPILRELPEAQRRKTRMQNRGNFMDLGDEVSEGVPSVFPPLPKDAPRNRLTLAKWLVSPDNPLTARVTANRFWEKIFGVGIVRTSEEFGIQGELPSHPELLDWLAVELASGGRQPPVAKEDVQETGNQQGADAPRSPWNIKRFLKRIVMSATYRQSAKVTPELYDRDPENRLLARGPRVRLSAEMVRDQALFVSGLLSDKRLGPSVKPPQPDLGLKAAFGGSIDWKPSTGEDRYRRGHYNEWRRSNPYPSMSTFDAPNRDICTVRRARTNTPLQALVTMNDPVYVEAAQGLARRLMKEGGKSPGDKIAYAMRLCLCRPAKPAEIERLVALYEEAKDKFANDPAKSKDFATQPLGPLPKETDITDAAAWTVVASVILNLDEMFMKR
jgi:hypothetical protein